MNGDVAALSGLALVDKSGVPLRPPPSKERRRLALYGGMMLLDLGCIACGMLIANLVRFGHPLDQPGLDILVMLAPIYLAVAINGSAYSMAALMRPRDSVKRAILALFVAVAAVLLVAFTLKTTQGFSRLAFGIGVSTTLVLLIVGRWSFVRAARAALGGSPMTEVVIRDGIAVGSDPHHYLIDAGAAGLHPRLDDPVSMNRLGQYLRNADRVVVACPPERREDWAMALKGADVDGEVLLPELDHLGTLGLGDHGGKRTMIVSAGPLRLEERVLKRMLDLSIVLATAPLTLPLMALLAIAIRLDSRGPALFPQSRIGRGNRQFTMLKFRSMRMETLDSSGARSASRDDDRVTRLGRVLRATSLDELPQLLNVLKGDMAVVGPRPHATASRAGDSLFWVVDPRYWHRHAMKPGMTGLAQIRGFRGATECPADLTNRLQADLEYLSGWTIWRDLSIIAATFRVLVHRNAF